MEKRKLKLNIFAKYTILFFIAFFIIFIPFMKRGLSTVWEIDGVGQYYPAFLYIGQFIRDFFKTGRFISFDLRIAMGEDVFSALNYYGLGDPLNIISVFSNKSNGMYLFAFMYFLRIYLAGVSFIIYCRYMKLNDKLIVPGAFIYLSSGYMFCACLMYIEFISPLIYFPLLLLACEKFFKEKKWWWMVIVSAYAALCTMYLFYMAALFLVPYALIRTWFIFDKDIKKVVTNCFGAGALAGAGIAITFPVLYPSLKGMLISERAAGDVIGVITALTNYRPRRYNTVQFFKGFLPTYDEGVFFFHEIPVLSYLAIALLFVLVIYCKKRSNRNIQLVISTIIGCVLFTMPITNLVFSGFVPGFSYDRWIFMLEFLFALVFICSLDDLINEKFSGKKYVYEIVTALAVMNIVINGVSLYEKAGKEFTDAFLRFDEVSKYTDSPVNYSSVINEDGGLFRVSNDSLTNINGRPENVQMINNYYGLTFWLSVVNPNMQKIADQLEELNSHGFVDQRMFGLENSVVEESLAGVKYYMQHDNADYPEDYILRESIDFYGEKWNIYENPHALPICFGYSADFYKDNLKSCYYANDEKAIDNAIACESVVFENDTFTCKINMDEDGVVLLAVPYSDGWSVTIDDEAATVYNSDIYYMAVDVEAGEHTIVYKYSSYCF